MRIVIACDSFKGTATATQAADALSRGWRLVRPDDEVALRPMADGGEGTMDAFETGVPGSARRRVTAVGPLGESREATWLQLPDGTAVIELAATSGITLLPAGVLRPNDATTTGFGQAIVSALGAGATRLLLAIGSSCSTDGGAGALTALGGEFLDAGGRPIRPGARGLLDLASVDLDRLAAVPRGGAVVLSDVTNPLTGPMGAAAVFGPQKGATPADVPLMDAALTRLAAVVAGRGTADPSTPGAGAAGGTGFGMLLWGASIEAGARVVADLLDLPAAVASADVVITGEGRFDAQSAAGKAPSLVLELAELAGTRALLVAGSIDAGVSRFAGAVSLTELAGSAEAALQDPLGWLERAGSALARSASRGMRPPT